VSRRNPTDPLPFFRPQPALGLALALMSLNAARPRLRGGGGPGSASTGGGKTTRRPDRERSQLTVSGVPRTLGGDRLLGITQTLRRQLAFVQYATISLAAQNTYNESYLYLNSAYHVDTALNSVGFAKYMAFYTKCFVVSARYRVSYQWIPSTPGGVVVGVNVTTNTASLGTAVQAIETGLSRHRPLGLSPDNCSITGAVNHARFLGKPNYLDDPQLFCTIAAAPGQVVVLHVWGQTGNATGVLEVTIEIVQDVVFTDPIPFT